MKEKQDEFNSSLTEGVTQPVVNQNATHENLSLENLKAEDVTIKTEDDEMQV